MQKLLSKVNSNMVYTVKESYNLSNLKLGKLIGVSQSLINIWLNSCGEVRTSIFFWSKIKLLYKYQESSDFVKKLVKFLVRFY